MRGPRLPFKRLNPVPKEDANPGVKKARNSKNALDQNTTPCPDLSHPSSDNMENSCQAKTEIQFVPKLVNGRGPLDNFMKKNTKKDTSQSSLLIDLTEDSDYELNDLGNNISNKVAPFVEKTNKEIEGKLVQSGSQEFNCNTQVDVLVETCPMTVEKDELSNMFTEKEISRVKESNLKNVVFERKMPMVVLEDIMTARSLQPAPLEKSLLSGNEMVDSFPEEDTPCTSSSLSSISSTSSPESLPIQECNNNVSPLAASTPFRKASQKIHRNSAEKEKMKVQRDQERADKLQKQQAEREEKGRLKEEAKAAKERAREEAKRKKEEEKEMKEREKRVKKEKDEKEKAEKLRVKEEKRKEKQEALEAKQEEKRKKEEEKRLKEEEKRIKAERAEITRFFHKPKTQPAPKILAGWCGKFAPFEIKENMVLAPLSRVVIDQDHLDRLDWLLQSQSYNTSLLKDLKSQEPCKSWPTRLNHSTDDVNSDVVIMGSSQSGDIPERKKFGRMKLLQFCENHRPAYWGTWNKKSSTLTPRNPWSKDEKLLDYEVESDEEWEEEEPGESLSHSEGDEDEDGGEEDDDDDGFFVPHGYLSEDEGVTEECDPENHKARQKLKAKEWDELITKGKRFRILQPVKIGCVWEGEESSKNTSADLKLLQQFAASVLDSSIADEEQIEKNNKKTTKDKQILGQLLPLLHGNTNGSKVIIQEFQECYRMGLLLGTNSPTSTLDCGNASPTSPNTSRAQTPVHEGTAIPSKARLKRIISENSVYEKRPEHRMCWYVHPEVLKSYGQENLPVPCQWNYITHIPLVAKEDYGNSPGVTAQATPILTKRKSTGSMSITRFMKRPSGADQAETTEMDGFQADTEEEDEDECIIVELQQSKAPALKNPEMASETEGEAMEVLTSETAAAAIDSSNAI
ncbi:hypothetical protein lerEdw1_006881 [Lerista edwardsae]|nr:hypothetical protein lerEdw1_006881 [Lerista edwardsae]